MKIILLLLFIATFVANAIHLKYQENLENLNLKYTKDRKCLYRRELTKLSADLKEKELNRAEKENKNLMNKSLMNKISQKFRKYLNNTEQNSNKNNDNEKFIKQIDQTLTTESDTELDFILVKDLHGQIMMQTGTSPGEEFLEKLDKLKIKYFEEREKIYKKELKEIHGPKYEGSNQLIKCLQKEKDNGELIQNLIIYQLYDKFPEYFSDSRKNKFMLNRLLTEFVIDEDELVKALLKYQVLRDSRQFSEELLEIILQFLGDGPKEKLLLEQKNQNLNYVVEQFAEKNYSKMKVLVENVNRKTLTKCMEDTTPSGNGLHVLFSGVKDDHDLQKILNVFLDHPESLLHCLNMENTEGFTPYHYIGSDAMKLNEIGSKDIEIMNTMVDARKSYARKMLDDREFFNHLVVRSKVEKNYGELEKKYHNFAALVFGQKNRKDGTEHMINTKRGNKQHLQNMIDGYIYREKQHVRGIKVHEEEEEEE